MHRAYRLSLRAAAAVLLLIPAACAGPAVPPAIPVSAQTYAGLGAAQGVTVYHDKIYLYGDAKPGVLREYNLTRDAIPQLIPTGRCVQLTRGGVNLLNHPTGLALHEGLPCFLGNTVTATKEGRIYCLDLARAFHDTTLDHAVLNETLDDAAVQGCRPEYVRLKNRFVIATADYGPGPNYVRFYDPERLAHAARTTEPGVLLRRVPCGPWVQMLCWIDESRTLVMVQNIIEGRRWRLTVVSNLEAADYRAGPDIRVIDIPGKNDELEGYAKINPQLGIFITSSRANNVTFASSDSSR